MTEAGWYDDPNLPGTLRWWDGTAWTEHTHQVESPAPVQAEAQPQPAPQPTSAATYAGMVDQPVPTSTEPSSQGLPALMWLAIVIGIVGLLAGVAAANYYTVPAHSLPSVLGKVPCPVHRPNCSIHRVQRGRDAAVAAVVLLVIAVVIGIVARRSRSQA